MRFILFRPEEKVIYNKQLNIFKEAGNAVSLKSGFVSTDVAFFL